MLWGDKKIALALQEHYSSVAGALLYAYWRHGMGNKKGTRNRDS